MIKQIIVSESEIIIEDNQFAVDIQQQRPASLGGGADGEAKITLNPDSRGFQIKWDNGEDTRIAKKLAVGEHSVTITGDKGCTTVGTIEISEALAPLSVSIETTKELDCPGNETAAIEAKVKGGQGPYTYAWENAKGNAAQVANLGAGSYTLKVTDAEGTNASATIEITPPGALTAEASARAAASTNNADGKAKVSASGGAAPYTFKWDSGESTETAAQLAAGKHEVTVTDAKGCTTIATVEISENILALGVDLKETKTVDCNGGSSAILEAEVRGGKSPFQFAWSTPNGSETKATGLVAGEYKVSVTDAAGNVADASYFSKTTRCSNSHS